MRRKFSPNPIVTGGPARELAPARRSTALPTAAAIALALSAWGCSAPIEESVRADTVTMKKAPAPSASAPALNAIDPDPVHVDGEMAMVKPKPVTSATVKPFVGGPRPTTKPPKLAGKPMVTHPTI